MNWRDDSSQLTRKPYFISDSREVREENRPIILERFFCSMSPPNKLDSMLSPCLYVDFPVISIKY